MLSHECRPRQRQPGFFGRLLDRIRRHDAAVERMQRSAGVHRLIESAWTDPDAAAERDALLAIIERSNIGRRLRQLEAKARGGR